VAIVVLRQFDDSRRLVDPASADDPSPPTPLDPAVS
jgi:hypothetical protein